MPENEITEPIVSSEIKDQFKFRIEPYINVRVGLSKTVNVGKYESVKSDISVSVNVPIPRGADTNKMIDGITDNLKKRVSNKIEEFLSEEVKRIDRDRRSDKNLYKHYSGEKRIDHSQKNKNQE
ncbi:MAG: hypothetical protein GF329_22745 [Candidatus Lokiarchaeota archaeon]|nr:hypothetical protein [Candidatus Lokiarchaeota archaeon]